MSTTTAPAPLTLEQVAVALGLGADQVEEALDNGTLEHAIDDNGDVLVSVPSFAAYIATVYAARARAWR